MLADRNDLKTTMALVTRLIARRFCSTLLLRYLTWRTVVSTSRSAPISSIAALLAALLSIATLLRVALAAIADEVALRCSRVVLGCQREVDGLDLLIDRAVEIFSRHL